MQRKSMTRRIGGRKIFEKRRIQHHAIKTRTKLEDGLQRTLYVVEEGHKRAEGIRNCVWVTMLVQHGQHLKALAVVKSPLIVKEKAERTLANSIPNLPLPEKTSHDIGRSSNESIIQTLGGVLGLTKIILDHVMHIQISFGILDDRKLERIQRPKRNRSGREDQLRRRRSWGRSSDARRRWRRGQWNR